LVAKQSDENANLGGASLRMLKIVSKVVFHSKKMPNFNA